VSGARVAFSYQRVSAAKQATDKSDGLHRQADAFLPFCQRHGLTPADDHLQDSGVSAFRGKNRQRGALGAFIEAARDGAVPDGAVLVVEDLDRFSRQATSHQEKMLGELFDQGLALGIVRDDLIVDRTTYDTKLDVRLQLLVRRDAAHDYSRKLSERVAASHASRRARGEKTRHPRPFWCDWSDAAQDFTINDKVAIPRRMVDLCIEGAGMTQIAQAMNREGMTNSSGGKITYAWVRRVLADRRLLGERAWSEGGKVARVDHGYFPPLVSEGEFGRAWELIRERDSRKGRHGRGEHLHNIFQGITYCACGQGLTYGTGRSRTGERVYAYLRCVGKISGTCTVGGRNHRYDEEWLLRGFMAQRWGQFFHKPADGHQRRQLQGRVRELEALAAQHREAAQRAESSLSELLTSGTLALEDVQLLGRLSREAAAKADAVDRERDKVRHQLQQLDAKPSGDAMAAVVRERVEAFMAADRLDVAERRRFNNWLGTLGLRVVLSNSGLVQMSVGPTVKATYDEAGNVTVAGGEFVVRVPG
jgi:DNA invertase Pin-like site-specific DNA recombinase